MLRRSTETANFQAARALGGNAIVAVDVDYENITMGQGGGMLMVSTTGTGVVLE